MATLCKFNDLTPEQTGQIINLLTLQPVDPSQEERKKFKYAAPVRYTSIPDPVLMYQLSEDKQAILIPFRFGCSLLGRMVNQDRPHIKAIDSKNSTPFVATLRENQVEDAIASLNYLTVYGSTTIGLPPGRGKTMLGMWLWYLMKYVGLIYTHREIIADQWWKTIEKSIPEILSWVWYVGKNGPPTAGFCPAVIICVDGRYDHIPQYIKDAVGTLIIDEAHLFCTPCRAPQPAKDGKPQSTGCLMAIRPRYIIIETATLERPNQMHAMMQAIAGTHGVYKISEVPYYVICVDTNIKVDESKTSRGVSYVELCKSFAVSSERNGIILDIVRTNQHRKFMIQTRLKTHASLMEQMFKLCEMKCGTLYGKQNAYYDSPILIGTMPKMGTGMDEENLCQDYSGARSDTLILAHSVKQWQLYEQLRGRVMRCEAPIVIWLRDKNAMSRRHFKDLEEWITKTKGVIVNVTYRPGGIVLPAAPQSTTSAVTAMPLRITDLRCSLLPGQIEEQQIAETRAFISSIPQLPVIKT